MRKAFSYMMTVLLISVVTTSCDTLRNLPTNTTGGVFSLNGTWRLSSTTDNNANVGTTITVYPIVGNATVKTLSNNTYCIRENDDMWRNVKSNQQGGFTISTLVNACDGTTVYRDGLISVVNNDEITVTTRTAGNSELVQHWVRVRNDQQ